jgi:hypothetical protein
MGKLAAKFASAIVIGILAGASLTTPQHAANAAECLDQPRLDAAKGLHWYYRIDRATKRHCWYLREEGEQGARAAPSDVSASDSSRAPDSAAQSSGPAPHSLQDAHAEFPAPQPRSAGGAVVTTQAAPAPNPPPFASPPLLNSPQETQESAVASRWPTQSDAAPSATSPPAAMDSGDPQPSAQDLPAPAAAMATPPAATNAATGKSPASLQTLFAAIIGALALAGVTASIIVRLGRARRTRIDARRRAAIWDGVDNAPKPEVMPEPLPPWVEPVTDGAARARTDARRSRTAPQSATTQQRPVVTRERYEKMEEILAQLVKQAQQSGA